MSDLVDVEILQDPLANELLAVHGIEECIICHEFPVFAVIVCHDEDWAIPVCATCFRNAPLVGQVVS